MNINTKCRLLDQYLTGGVWYEVWEHKRLGFTYKVTYSIYQGKYKRIGVANAG